MKRKCFKTIGAGIAAFLFLVPGIVSAEDVIGRIAYLEGIVDLQRDGEIIELWDTDIGYEILNYDLIETGIDGFIEIEMLGQKNRGTKVKVENDTAFYFDSAKVGGDSRTNINMLSGALAFKVQHLTGNEQFNVKTESAVMGVRGTEFAVKRAPEGSVLVTCVEGKVACEDTSRRERFASPGSIVEKRPDEDLTRIDVDPGDENLYSVYWTGKREEIFRAGAETFVKGYSSQYMSLLPRFLEAYDKLEEVRDLLVTYGSDEASSGYSSKMITVKSEVSDEMIMMRSILPLFEHSFYAVQVLEGYHELGIGRVSLDKNYTSDDFFAEFSLDKLEIKQKLANVRYFIKLYININRASSPGELDTPSFFEDMMTAPNPMGGGVPSGSAPAPAMNF